MEIIVDDRERAIFPYLDECAQKHKIDYKIQRNENGDFAICYNGKILMIIERKTWEDLAASMTDGRKDNINKLIAVRTSTNCKIAYLIEGDACPAFTKKVGAFPIKNLRSHLDHLVIRDDVHIFYSKDQEYTAKRIFEIAQNYLTLPTIIKGAAETTNSTDILKEKLVPNLGINEQLLRCIPGVGSIISTLLAEAGVTIATLYNCTISLNDLACIKYSSGTMIGMTVAQKIYRINSIIDSSSQASKKIKVRMLSCIPLISKITAEAILLKYNLSDIIKGNIKAEDIAVIYKTDKARIGPKAAFNVVDAFRSHTSLVDDGFTLADKVAEDEKDKVDDKVAEYEKDKAVEVEKKIKKGTPPKIKKGTPPKIKKPLLRKSKQVISVDTLDYCTSLDPTLL